MKSTKIKSPKIFVLVLISITLISFLIVLTALGRSFFYNKENTPDNKVEYENRLFNLEQKLENLYKKTDLLLSVYDDSELNKEVLERLDENEEDINSLYNYKDNFKIYIRDMKECINNNPVYDDFKLCAKNLD